MRSLNSGDPRKLAEKTLNVASKSLWLIVAISPRIDSSIVCQIQNLSSDEEKCSELIAVTKFKPSTVLNLRKFLRKYSFKASPFCSAL